MKLTLTSLNTKPIAVSGLALGLLGLLAPGLASHWVHDPVVLSGVQQAGAALVTIGLGGAYAGMPAQLPQQNPSDMATMVGTYAPPSNTSVPPPIERKNL